MENKEKPTAPGTWSTERTRPDHNVLSFLSCFDQILYSYNALASPLSRAAT